MEILDFLVELIDQYGYIIVTLAILLESVGIPMPGETALVVAAAFAGAGHLNIALVITCAAVGAIVGDAGGYWVGRRLGRPFLETHGKWLRLTPERIRKLEELFVRHGPMTIFFGRFFTLLRTFAAIFAGVGHMPYRTFTLYNALGGIVWSMCFGILGYLFGQNLPLLEHIAKTVGWVLTIPLALMILFAFAWRWIVRHRTELIQRANRLVERSFIGYIKQRYSWHIHWLLRRWTAVQYTILHIVSGLIIASAGTWAFIRVGQSALSDARIALWDRSILFALQDGATPLATMVFRIVTALGSYGVAAIAIYAVVFFFLRRQWLNAVAMSVVILGGQLLVLVLKLAYARPRPDIGGPFPFSISGFSFSFPSAHTMESLIVYGMIAYFIILRFRRWEVGTGVILLTTLLVLTIGFSRIYLGVSYLSDVLCGLAGGVVWLSSCLTALELLRRDQIGDRRRQHRQQLARIRSYNI
jgi:membrane protein DedA with SNARE-associated domain/membrane-associated phospholipid phosphatase